MNGIIVKAIGGIYYVEASDGIYECKARGAFRRKNISPVGGDRVEFSLEDDGSGVIEKIEERRSLLIRPPLANLQGCAGGQAVGIYRKHGRWQIVTAQ